MRHNRGKERRQRRTLTYIHSNCLLPACKADETVWQLGRCNGSGLRAAPAAAVHHTKPNGAAEVKLAS